MLLYYAKLGLFISSYAMNGSFLMFIYTIATNNALRLNS